MVILWIKIAVIRKIHYLCTLKWNISKNLKFDYEI
jgi:hypothetical protein